MNVETIVEMIRSLIQLNRDGVMVIDDQGRIVTHNTALVELLDQPRGTRFESTLRLGPVNLQRLLVRAAIAAGEQDVVGRPRWRAMDFRAAFDFREPPLPVRITSTALPLPGDDRQLRLVTIRPDVACAEIAADPDGFAAGSPLESAHAHCQAQLDHARRATAAGMRLLILGETGTGKTLLAKTLHRSGRRGAGPFVDVHCAALPGPTLESELFGHARGAFPGATAERAGRLEETAGGTLLLDEISAMSPLLQGALLRALDEGRFERMGENRTRHLDASIISTSSLDLRHRIAEGRFRADLYHRLAGVSVMLPPLRERPEDLDAIVDQWSAHHRIAITEAGRRRLRQHPWPGNFRELRNRLEALHLGASPGGRLGETEIGEALSPQQEGPMSNAFREPARLPGEAPAAFSAEEERERETLRVALAAHKGNRSQAARSLGIDRTTLWRKLHRLRLIQERSPT
ncbi:sigma 54-interacting transcriptional regulator [Thioalkalivibrio sp.]|uniref:sigma 54-interacting transcriptional regulator n=1 Tax=Thioalkalivibrio sp. TaxID=2093813 RepID=UPI0039758EE8